MIAPIFKGTYVGVEPLPLVGDEDHGDQAGSGLIARAVTQYDDVPLYPPANFHWTVGEPKSIPDAMHFPLAAHLFAGTWVETN